jgi:flagellar biosynthesis protein
VKRDFEDSLAVALRYRPGEDEAPFVVASGRGEIARAILDLAARLRIPVRSDPELASFLIRLPTDHPIPPELYEAVALLLAYLYRYPGKGNVRPDRSGPSRAVPPNIAG